MKNLIKNFGLFFLIFLIIAVGFSVIEEGKVKNERVGIQGFVNQIEDEKIESVVIRGGEMEVVLRDGQKEIVKKEVGQTLTEVLYDLGVEKEKISKINIDVKDSEGWQFWLMNILPFLLPFLLIGGFVYFMMRGVQGANSKAMMFGQSQAKESGNDPNKRVTFKDVAGVKEAKEELKEIVEFLKFPKKFLDLGAKIPKGVLLLGSPGTGKTLLARATSGEAGVPFFHISGSVLVEMDGFDQNINIIVMAATNRPDVLDSALLRPGRFDRQVVLDNPDIADREAILKIHARKKPLAKDVSLRKIAERTPGFSGADLANILNEGAILTARRNKKIITMDELFESIEKVMLGPERKSRVITVKEKKITAYHEGGHAIVAHFLPNADPVHKISIIARGRAGGYTLKLPTEDKHMYTKREYIDEIAVLLGGYLTEKEIFGEVTTGATSDLRRATSIARRLITDYGMSEKLGPRTFGEKEEMIFLGREIHEQKDYSEKIAEQIDEEIAGFIKLAEGKAKEIIKSKKDVLEKVVARLLKTETIEREEFEHLVGKKK